MSLYIYFTLANKLQTKDHCVTLLWQHLEHVFSAMRILKHDFKTFLCDTGDGVHSQE